MKLIWLLMVARGAVRWWWRSRRRYSEKPRKVRLTVEWYGCADEACYGAVCAEEIERADISGSTVVTEIEPLTADGKPLAMIPGVNAPGEQEAG